MGFGGEKDNPVAASPISWNPYCMLKELLHHDGPSCSSIPRREKLAEIVWSFCQFALVWTVAPTSFLLFKNLFVSLGTTSQLPSSGLFHCLQFQFVGIPSIAIQLKLMSSVDIFETKKDPDKFNFVFILSDFTEST